MLLRREGGFLRRGGGFLRRGGGSQEAALSKGNRRWAASSEGGGGWLLKKGGGFLRSLWRSLRTSTPSRRPSLCLPNRRFSQQATLRALCRTSMMFRKLEKAVAV